MSSPPVESWSAPYSLPLGACQEGEGREVDRQRPSFRLNSGVSLHQSRRAEQALLCAWHCHRAPVLSPSCSCSRAKGQGGCWAGWAVENALQRETPPCMNPEQSGCQSPPPPPPLWRATPAGLPRSHRAAQTALWRCVLLSFPDPVASLNVKGAGRVFPASEEFKVKIHVLKELTKGPDVSLFLFLSWFI